MINATALRVQLATSGKRMEDLECSIMEKRATLRKLKEAHLAMIADLNNQDFTTQFQSFKGQR